jgi:hypothetical protein
LLKNRMSFAAVAFALLGILVCMLVGCGGSSSTSGTGTVQVSLVDAPLDASEVNVDIASVQAHKSEGGWEMIREFETPLHVNLLDYRTGGSALMLAEAPLDAGHYTMIRLMLVGAEIVVGGQRYTIDLQNVQQTGVKANGEFTVEAGQLIALMLDFNAGRSFVPTGSGGYMLYPVLAMSPVSIAAKVTGKVELRETEDGPAQTPVTDVAINVYSAGHAGDADYLQAGATVGEDGSFEIEVLAQGTYDIQIMQGETVIKTVEGISITAPTTDLGTITAIIGQP